MTEPNRILVLYAHPAPHRSRVHRALAATVADLPGVNVHELYEIYPNFDIDVAHEQHLLREHQVVIFQHPIYWYSTPAILHAWQEEVLTRGFAYGPGGGALRGKALIQALSTGSAPESRHGAERGFSLGDVLRPVEQVARFCGMVYLAPFVVRGAGSLDARAIAEQAQRYREHLMSLRGGPLPAPFSTLED